MLIALLTFMLLGGGSNILIADIQFVEKQLKVVMEKTDERKAALTTLKQMTNRTKKNQKILGGILKQQRRLVADHSSSPKDTDKLWMELTAERTAFHADMIKLRFEFKGRLSREDWTEIFKPG